MIRQSLLALILILGSLSLGWSQNEIDALRHSQQFLTGTARTLGMGGAFSAAGADLSAANLNPAGLGVYRGSSFVVSPAFSIVNTQSELLDRNQNQSATQLSLPSLGAAFTNLVYYDDGEKRYEQQSGLKSYTFAFGYNQLENYRRNAVATGAYNPYSSITQSFADQAQGIPFDALPFDSYPELAFQTFMIDTIANRGGTEYFPAYSQGQIEQTFQLEESGRRNEWYAAVGGNFGDKFFLGASVNLQTVRYTNTFNFNETDVDNLYEAYDPNQDNFPGPDEPGFDLEIPSNFLRFTDEFTTRGSGLGGRIGMIYRPVDALRVSFAAQTPTYLSLTDEFSTTVTHNFFDGQQNTESSLESELAEYSYSLFTPYRLTGGLMVLIKKAGFLTADVEYVDYSAAELSSGVSSINNPNFYDFDRENTRIESLYRGVLNLRVGGEARLGMFRLRAGYAYYPSPFMPEGEEYVRLNAEGGDFRQLVGVEPGSVITPETLDGARSFLTFGAGIRQPNFFLDVSLVNQRQADKFSPYSLADPNAFQPTIVNRVTRNTLTASMGFNF